MSTTINAIGVVPLAVTDGGTGQTSGTTGSGSVVLATSPTLVTPVIGVATASSIQFSPSTGGLVGVAGTGAATTGYVGERVLSIQTTNQSATTGVAANVTSISITAGDWDIYGSVSVNATTILTSAACWASTSSATAPDGSLQNIIYEGGSGRTQASGSIPYLRLSLSSTTTVYLSFIGVGTGTVTGSGAIYARRAR